MQVFSCRNGVWERSDGWPVQKNKLQPPKLSAHQFSFSFRTVAEYCAYLYLWLVLIAFLHLVGYVFAYGVMIGLS